MDRLSADGLDDIAPTSIDFASARWKNRLAGSKNGNLGESGGLF